jgi:hypothetical protein
MPSKLPGAFLNPYLNNPLIGREFEMIAPGAPLFVVTDDNLYVITDEGLFVTTG